MLYGLAVTFFVIVCFFLILFILIQQSKERTGLGSLGGSSQMLFGGSGGQELLQKITWILGAIFIVGSLVLSIVKTRSQKTISYLETHRSRT